MGRGVLTGIDNHRTTGGDGGEGPSRGVQIHQTTGGRNCRSRLHSSPKQAPPGSPDPLIFSSVVARNMMRVVRDRGQTSSESVEVVGGCCSSVITSFPPHAGGNIQRIRKRPAATSGSYETPRHTVDGNASDESTAESPGAGMPVVTVSPIRGFVDFDFHNVGHVSETEWTTNDAEGETVQDMDEGVPETQVHETSRARRDLFGPSSPSLPPMLLGAHPKPRAEDMRTQQKQATAGDKAFKDLVAKRIEARCAREVLSAAIRKFCCGRQCLRKLGSTRLKVIRTTFFSMTKGAQ